jgi:hypothetical protein
MKEFETIEIQEKKKDKSGRCKSTWKSNVIKIGSRLLRTIERRRNILTFPT